MTSHSNPPHARGSLLACSSAFALLALGCVGTPEEAQEWAHATASAQAKAMAPTSAPMQMDADAGPADHSMHAPSIPLANLPVGSAGHSDMRVESTQEAPLGGRTTGSFRTVCEFSHMNYDDPIVFPGESGKSHLHAYFGNTEADAFSTTESLLSRGNSTCRGGIANRSAYWVPATVDAGGSPVAPEEIMVYYKSGFGGIAARDIESFPEGLRMIAGSVPSDLDSLPSSHIEYQCSDEGYNPYKSIPSCTPGATLTMIVRFPQCWDGVNLDSDDHRSHMAYANGGCPATHPVPIPEITFNVNYVVPAQGSAGWRLVSDMYDESLPGGMSLHADWFAAWDQDIVDEFVSQCINSSSDCHAHLLGPNRLIF